MDKPAERDPVSTDARTELAAGAERAADPRGRLAAGPRTEQPADPKSLGDARTVVAGGAQVHRRGPAPSEARTIVRAAMSEARTIAAVVHVGPELELLSRGASVSRYVILDLLGAGGMGVVYAAYDPELDRKVAVKLLQVDRRGAAELEGRLRQEAQAMARLSHPNVVTVHDVGVHQGQIFLAMEMIDGATLRAWLAAAPRSWSEIVAIYLQAGRGLAAAHAAGLVHRDFKPDNVLCTRDGRACVGDFGLARARDRPSPRLADADAITLDDEGPRSSSLTRTGARMGTPAYMAPEQHLGVEVGPAADVFAFCVALYEALYDQHPFGGDDYLEIQARVLEGAVREPPRGPRAPPRVHRLLLRGLALDPLARPPSMDALLADLEAAARPRRRRLAALGGVLALAIGGGLWAMSQETDPSAAVDPALRCAGIDASFDDAWGPAREAELRRAFAGSGLVYAGDVADRVVTRLDDHRARWIASRSAACLAHHVAGEISSPAYARANACFEGRRRRVERLVALLVEADGDAIRQAVDVVDDLDPPEPCRDDAAIAGAEAADGAIHVEARRAEIEAAIEDARGWIRARRYDAAAAAMAALVAEIEPLGDTSERARAMVTWSSALLYLDGDAAEARASEAIALCWRARDERCVVDAVIKSLASVANDEDGLPQVELLLRLGLAALARIGGDLRDEARLRYYYASALTSRGHFERALDAGRDALALFRRLEDRLNIARATKRIGLIYQMLGRYSEAAEHLRESATILTAEFGADHPETAAAFAGLGVLSFRFGDYPTALDLIDRQLSIQRRIYGARSHEVAGVLSNRAIFLLYSGAIADAEATMRESIAIDEEVGKSVGVGRAEGLANLAEIERRKGDLGGAQADVAEAMDLLGRSLPADHPDWITAEAIAGHIARQRGDLRSAAEHYGRAHALIRSAGLADNPTFVDLWLGRADLALRRRRPADARAILVEAGPLLEGELDHAWDRATLRFIEARLAEADGDRKGAIAAAREAQRLYDGLMPGSAFERGEVVRWLERQPKIPE